jgi:hypothetical protein
MLALRCALAAAALFAATTACAGDLTVQGTGSAPVKGRDAQSIRAAATLQAKRQATIVAINRMLGADATANPAVAAKIDDIAGQIRDDEIVDSSSQTVNGSYQVTLSLSLDDKEFRKLLSDNGVALNENAARSHSILAIIDEYWTNKTDYQVPLQDLTEYSHQTGDHFSDTSRAGSSRNSASAAAAQSQSSASGATASHSAASGNFDNGVRARSQGSQSADMSGSGTISGNASGSSQDGTGTLSASQQAQFAASARQSGSASLDAHSRGQFAAQDSNAAAFSASSSASSASARSAHASSFDNHNVHSEDHDNVSYKHLVTYQPPSARPQKISQTYNALTAQLGDYDLSVLDNDVFKSRYFGDHPITFDQLGAGGGLDRYVTFARTEANADYFMVGAAVIIDEGVNPTLGEEVCTGVLTLKAYSTRSGEIIASGSVSEQASGASLDSCAANASRKIASSAGQLVGAKIQEFWKLRTMYGQQYVITFKATSISLMVHAQFSKALQSLPGVDSAVERIANAQELQYVVSYKGSDSIPVALATALAANPTFSNLDGQADGEQITMCLGPCSAFKR